jgi:hypothetical protein
MRRSSGSRGAKRNDARSRPDRRRRPGRADGLAAAVAARHPLGAGRAPSRHCHPSQGTRHQCPHHGGVPPAGHRGRGAPGRPATRALRLHRLGEVAGRRGDRAPRAVGPQRAQHRCLAGARLPLRPGLSRAGAAPVRRAAAAGRAALRHRAQGIRPGQRRCDRDAQRGRHRCRGKGRSALHDRRRRRAEPRARGARRAHGRQEGRLRQRQHPARGRSSTVDRGSSRRALLHRERPAARHLPHHQRGRPLGLPGEFAQGAGLRAGGFHARALGGACPIWR